MEAAAPSTKSSRTKSDDGNNNNNNNNNSKDDTKLDRILAPAGSHFSISLTPLLLGGYDGSFKSGCVLVYSAEIPADTHLDEILEDFLTKLQNMHSKPARLALSRAVTRLIAQQTDSGVEILSAVKKGSKVAAGRSIAGQDEIEWFITSQMVRSYGLLRRLAMPMHFFHAHSGGNGTTLETLEISLLDLLLKLEGLKDIVQKAICTRIASLRRDALKTGKRPTEVELCRELEGLLTKSLSRAGISSPKESSTTDTKDEMPPGESCTVPEHMQKEIIEVRNERRRLLRELEERKKRGLKDVTHFAVGGKTKLKGRMHNGCLLVTENEMTHSEFCRQVKVMVKVNKTLPRPYTPGVSRPRLHSVDFPPDALSKLRALFFNDDGSLRKSIVDDVDLSTRHGYINFSNASCRHRRNDYRWQVPIQRHGNSFFVATRAAVESLFSEQRLLHPHHEKIHDLGILIGGTEDQSIHHDIPRQTTCWLPEDPDIAAVEGVPVNGWEFDRAAYNEAMASPYAPSSILLGMSASGNLQVGVQKNQVEKYGCAEGWCRILDGRKEDEFQIMRENDFLVVLQANPGALFTGDFPHAGVRNFAVGSAEDKLMMKFYGKIERILEEGQENGEDHAEITKEMIKMMCNFKGLNRLCRFHCSTEPTSGPLRIPRNTVGFVDCKPNPPDVGIEGRQDEEALRTGLWSAA